MKKINFKTLLLAIGLVVASTQPAWANGYYEKDGYHGQVKIYFNDHDAYCKVGTTSKTDDWSADAITKALYLDAYWVNVWKSSGTDISSSTINYRFYLENTTPPSWSNYNGGWISDNGNWDYNDHQTWGKESGMSINLLSKMTVGGYYYLEFYFEGNGAGYLNGTNGGNYKIKFKYDPKYTVTIAKGNGGQSVSPTSASVGNINAVEISATAATGYNFKEWTKDNDNIDITNSKSASTTIKARADGTVTATFSPKSIKFTFEKNGGTCTYSTTSKDYDAVLEKLNNGYLPTKNGYDFQGYYTSDGTSSGNWGSQLIDPSGNWQVVSGYTEQSGDNIINKKSSNCTIYAKWAVHEYTITYKDQGNKTFSGTSWGETGTHPETYTIETATITLASPAKVGYNFGGWFSNADCTSGNEVTQIQIGSFGDKTLYAKWTPIVTTVTVNMNGGDNENQEMEETFDAEFDISSLDQSKFTRTGYDFKGLYTANTGGSYLVNENWVKRSSSAVAGWLNSSATAKWVNPNTEATIFAQWTAHQWTITLNDGEGSGGDGSKLVTYGTNTGIISVTKPTRETYNFAGYEDANQVLVYDANGDLITNAMGYTDASKKWIYDGDVTLSAKWISAGNYVITLDNLSATTPGTLSVDVQINTTKGLTEYITCPTKTGYTFGGYFTETGGSGTKLINADGSWVIPTSGFIDGEGKWIKNENVTLKAKWDANKTIVTLDKQGGTSSTSQRTLTYNSTQNLDNISETTKTGYIFGGYFTGKNGTGTQLVDENGAWIADVTGYTQTINSKLTWVKTTTDPLTLYAKWTENMTTVTLSAGVGGNIDPTATQSVGVTTTVQVTATPATGYTFNPATGWEVTGNAVKTDANPTTLSGSGEAGAGTLTANFTEIKVSIVPTVNQVGSDQSYTATASVAEIGIATTSTLNTTAPGTGFKFIGWELSNNIIVTSGNKATDRQIIIRTNGDGQAVSAVANYAEDLSTSLHILGDSPLGGWVITDANRFTKRPGESTLADCYYSFDIAGTDVECAKFKLNDDTKGWAGAGNNAEFTYQSYDNSHQIWFANDQKDVKFKATVPGTYTFHFFKDGSDDKLELIYPDVYCLMGAFNSWSSTSHPFDRTSNQVSIELEENKEYAFRVVYQGKYYRVNGKMTSTSCTDWYIYNNKDNAIDIKIQTTVAGTYTFTFNPTTKQLSVTYPGEEHHTVTVDNGESTKEVDVKEVTETEISAPQYLNGLRFAGWIATNSTGGDESENITINHPENRVTHIKAAKKEGIIVRATYNTNYMVYFKNTPGWGDVHVFFYTVDRHWKDNGTGVKYYDDNEKKWVQIATGHHMTRLNDKSDIWYYDYSGVSDVHGAIAFNDHNQYDYEYFANCQAAYRTDWDRGHNLSVFVPEKNISEKKNNNSAAYYNKGYWMKYDDLKTGYYLRVKGKTESGTDYEFKVASAGEPYKTTITLEAGQTKEFWINGVNGSSYKNAGTMTSSGSHSGWEFYEGDQANCKITTTSEGTYTFTLTFGEGMLLISVDYPLSENDYRVVYTDSNHPCHPSTFIRKGNGNKDTVSFFVDTEKDPALKFQYCSKIEGSTVTWTDVVGGTINISGITETGIYNFNLEQDANSISCTSHELYKGNFYIRTAIAPGGWDAYLGTDGNTLPYIEYGLDDSQPFKFTHAYTNWVEKDKNVKFCIANDYSLCISDTLVGDDIIGHEVNADWLKNGANIRFMWNKNTNALSRAYISGSTNDAEKFLMLENTNDKMYNKAGNEQIDELKFDDKNNWVYQADIQAQPGCEVRLTAQYTIGTTAYKQYFIGSETESKEIISGTGDKKYKMRAVYDFKTNRLTAGWIPDDETIDTDIKLGGDMLLVREHQGNASQITFGTKGSVSDIHHIYSVLTIKKDVMLGQNESGYTTAATNADYERTMYWISFPFDVKISEVFGVDGYGKKWIMQRYNGEKRAEIGWFAETETFWEYLAPTSTLQAYKGYLLILNANYFNTNGADVWKNSATEANFYFPSAEKNIGIINKSFVDVPVPAHVCGIDRPFADDANKNHKITDSYWNVIGVPAFQDATAEAAPVNDDFKSYYEWVPATNTYKAKVTMDGVTFKTMHAYMVQFGGTLKWTDVSVVNNPAPAPYAYADAKNYRIELFFNGNGAEDHTYINLADGASTDFVLNEDMMKIDNSGQPNIYSFAGAYDVAYNETTMDNQSVMLGVSAPKDGSYTFAMPKDFSGKAVLVDLESGEATDLNLSNYTVELNKGTYNNRFQLLLEVEAKAPTAIDNAKGEWSVDGKTKKLFINDNIYLINAGRVYNASGTKVR